MFRFFLNFILCLSLCAKLSAGPGDETDPIAKYYVPGKLFDITEILKDPQFRPMLLEIGYTQELLPEVSEVSTGSWFRGLYQSVPQEESDLETGVEASLEKLRNALEANYLKNRSQLYRQGLKQESVSALMLPVLFLSTFCGVEAMDLDPGGYSTALFTINILYSFTEGVKPIKPLITNWMYPENDPLYSFEREYALKKLRLNFLDMKEDLENYENYKSTPFPEEQFLVARRSPMNMRDALQLLNLFFKIPTESIEPQFPFRAIDLALDLYSQEAKDVILNACMNHQSSYRSILGLNPQTREFVNLVSTPGTGKSYCVEEIGRLMKLPVVTLCLAGATPDSLFGASTIPGLLLEKLGEMKGVRNGILFFDELDRVLDNNTLLSVLLPFLEPNTKKFYSPYLKRNIDVSHLFVFVGGNLDFTDPALKNRFHEQKTAPLEIVNAELLVETVMTSYLAKKLKKEEDVPEELKQQWRAAIVAYLERLVPVEEKIKENEKGKEKEQKFVRPPYSFRDAQALIDRLLGAWRLEKLKIE